MGDKESNSITLAEQSSLLVEKVLQCNADQLLDRDKGRQSLALDKGRHAGCSSLSLSPAGSKGQWRHNGCRAIASWIVDTGVQCATLRLSPGKFEDVGVT